MLNITYNKQNNLNLVQKQLDNKLLQNILKPINFRYKSILMKIK